MGYPSINEFDKNFIKRTLKNLECQVENTFTHLLNSLLGLIILPRQWNLQGRREATFFNKRISEFSELTYLEEITHYTNEEGNVVEINVLEMKPVNASNITLKNIIDKMCHSIAHQAIRPTNNGEKWEGVIFRNYGNDTSTSLWNDEYDFQLYLTQRQLDQFVKFISAKYLETFMGNTNE